MRSLSFLIAFIFLLSLNNLAQSPHGESFNIDCSECHDAASWKVNIQKVTFDHSVTNFSLTGNHKNVNCNACHSTLVFTDVPQDCISCHKDIHAGTTGAECAACHTPDTWIVKDINSLHMQSRFQLLGAHKTADCQQCHSGYTELNFEPLGINCIDCHSSDYFATQNPNHVSAGFSTDCNDCHSINSIDWISTDVIHDFFPLIGGHAIANCFSCHEEGGNFAGLSSDCFACHEEDYNSSQNPNHIQAQFSTDCSQCHTIFAFVPASFDHNITAFPLTGQHTTASCQSCHSAGYSGTPSECYSCHQQDYESAVDPNHILAEFPTSCQDCHTTSGWEPATFDHNITSFPLTGAHISADCSSCHESGFTSTPSDCLSCHLNDYNSTTDPNHSAAGFPTACNDCHTTSAWVPADFDHALTSFPLTGAHTTVNCISCHESGYTGTPSDCVSCHLENYNSTTNPNHTAAGFPTTCNDCHNTTAWEPAQFDHDGQYFPIYSGKHKDKWNTCSDCHTVQNNFSIFSCIDCHEHNKPDMDDEHEGVNGYIYESNACLSCHPTGEDQGAFNHSNTEFILDGAHNFVECSQCHQSGYAGTSTECYDCHTSNYNSSINPDHNVLSLPTDCSGCHSTNPGWSPASFPVHNQFYILTGRHLEIANDCATCHDGNYINTVNQCFDCHQTAYSTTQNPNHTAAGISQICSDCHGTSSWIPSTFDHSLTGFGLTGQHSTLECSSCHEGTTTGLTNECYACHQEQYSSAPDHLSQNFPTNCELCHNSTAWNQVSFNHQLTGFPLTGAHLDTQCSECHESGYAGTSNICVDCHQSQYQQSSNPNHVSLSLSTDCQSCHTTNPGWEPASFPNHSNYYQLIGAHLSIANNCINCHNGNYNNTPNTCIGCHQENYNLTTDPPHAQFAFSFDCLDCHSMNGWSNATFNHSFYPLSGDHRFFNCSQCHSQSNYQPDCLSCHLEDFLDEHDPGDPTDCWNCHNTDDWDDDGPIKLKKDRGVRML